MKITNQAWISGGWLCVIAILSIGLLGTIGIARDNAGTPSSNEGQSPEKWYECLRSAGPSNKKGDDLRSFAATVLSDGSVVVLSETASLHDLLTPRIVQTTDELTLFWLFGDGTFRRGLSTTVVTKGPAAASSHLRSPWAHLHSLMDGRVLVILSDRRVLVAQLNDKWKQIGLLPESAALIDWQGTRGSADFADGSVLIHGVSEIPVIINLRKSSIHPIIGYEYSKDGPIIGMHRIANDRIVFLARKGVFVVNNSGQSSLLALDVPDDQPQRVSGTYSWAQNRRLNSRDGADEDEFAIWRILDAKSDDVLTFVTPSGRKLYVASSGEVNELDRPYTGDEGFQKIPPRRIPLTPDVIASVDETSRAIMLSHSNGTVENIPFPKNLELRSALVDVNALADGRLLIYGSKLDLTVHSLSALVTQGLSDFARSMSSYYTISREGRVTSLEDSDGRPFSDDLNVKARLPSGATILGHGEQYLLLAPGGSKPRSLPLARTQQTGWKNPFQSDQPWELPLIEEFRETFGQTLLGIATPYQPLVLLSSTIPITQADVVPPKGGTVETDRSDARLFKWIVRHECAAAFADFRPRVRVQIGGEVVERAIIKPITLNIEKVDSVAVEAAISLSGRGDYRLDLVVDSPLMGNDVVIGRPVTGTMGWSAYYSAVQAIRVLAVVVPVFYFGIWFILFVAMPISHLARLSFFSLMPFQQVIHR